MPESVILYSTGCPKCNILKKKMDAKGIVYNEVVDVDIMLELGIKHVPIMRVGDATLDFSAANAWINQYTEE